MVRILYIEISNDLASDLRMHLAKLGKKEGRNITMKEFVIEAIREKINRYDT